MWSRERGYITADAREQTAYGVARGYIAVGISSQNNGNEAPSSNFSSNRAFVQWAGMTAGLTVSFFDYYPAAALLIRAGLLPQEDSGDGGIWVWGYTAQLGNGLGATISAEERRTSQIIGMNFNIRSHSQRQRRASGWYLRRWRRIWWLAGAGHHRQSPARPDLGRRSDHGRVA